LSTVFGNQGNVSEHERAVVCRKAVEEILHRARTSAERVPSRLREATRRSRERHHAPSMLAAP